MKTNYNSNKKNKICFCVGPENCNDSSCPLVQEHKKKKNKPFKPMTK